SEFKGLSARKGRQRQSGRDYHRGIEPYYYLAEKVESFAIAQ
ncbi:unnamed protein product, partial [marine sediment metagenome]